MPLRAAACDSPKRNPARIPNGAGSREPSCTGLGATVGGLHLGNTWAGQRFLGGHGRRRAAEEPDHRHRRVLRLRHERPRRRCTAEQRDELAALHVWMAPAWQEKM
jgi:hypothetical protein